MAVTEAEFDADLTTLTSAVGGYITASQAKIAALEAAVPPGVDLSAEDEQVNTAATALSNALDAINPVAVTPPGGGTGTTTTSVQTAKAALSS